jgi:hypothetical protein
LQEDYHYNEAPKAFLTLKKSKTLTLEDEKPKYLQAPMGVVDTSTSPGRNFFILSLFRAFNTSSKRSIHEEQLMPQK